MKSELRLFVYGTLKSGFCNHERYCANVSQISPAWLCGKLFKLTTQIPMMTIPAGNILARGTENPAKDIETQEYFESLLRNGRSKGYAPGAVPHGRVQGQLLTFGDPLSRLPFIDSLEEFNPGKQSTYARVLVHANLSGDRQTCAWTYIAGFDPIELEKYNGENWEWGRACTPVISD